ncbi:MAG: GDSL-type esterase/lipase family protein [Akkermansiaceae bacterium]
MRFFLILLTSLSPLLGKELTPYLLFERRHPDHPATGLNLAHASTLEAHAAITRPDFLNSLNQRQRRSLIPLRDTLASNLRAQGHPRFPSAPGYQRRKIRGWTIFVHHQLLKKEAKDTTRALQLLECQLQDIVERVPTPAVAYLKNVPLYFSPARNGRSSACHHPSSQWLKNNGFPVELAKSIEYTGVHDFEKETRRMPNVALHELAHAYHNHLLGDEHPGILAAYRAARKSGRFKNLPRRTGDLKKPLRTSNGETYAMTNQMEYFAEATEAYFAENDFTPFDRAALKEWDPMVVPLLEKVWGIRKSKHPLLAADRILFLGDSITASRSYIIDLQVALHLRGHVPEIIASGLPSEGVTGLSEPKHPFPRPNVHERLARALKKVKPDLVIACYGMNDGIYHPFSINRFQAYQRGLQNLINEVNASGAKLILVTPPPFDVQAHKNAQASDAKEFHWNATYKHYDRDVIARYAKCVLAQKSRVTRVVDVHTPMTGYYALMRKKDPTFVLSNDGVHLDRKGHRLLASIIYQALFDSPLPELPEALVDHYTTRHNYLAPAWTSHIGHKRPRVKPGLPLDLAQAKAAAVLRK